MSFLWSHRNQNKFILPHGFTMEEKLKIEWSHASQTSEARRTMECALQVLKENNFPPRSYAHQMYPVAENRQAVAGSAHPLGSFLSKLFRFMVGHLLPDCLPYSLLHINLHANVFLLSNSVSLPPLPLCGHRIHVYLFPQDTLIHPSHRPHLFLKYTILIR